jgi:hypothetical protein
MKKVLLLMSCLSVGFIIACGGGGIRDSSVNPSTENLLVVNTYKQNIWKTGLIDHELHNKEVPPTPVMQVSFEDIKAIKFGDDLNPLLKKHYKIERTTTSVLFNTINKYYNEIDGIFVGLSGPRSGKTNETFKNQLFITFVKIDSVRLPKDPKCAVDVMTFFKTPQGTVNFKCLDPFKGNWELIPETDPIVTNFKINKKGVFIGKENLFNNILRKSNVMYLYTGTYLNERHFVAVDSPYFTANDPTLIGPGGTITPFYLSTLKYIPAPQCANYPYLAHGTSRLCPSNCPQ